MTVRCDVMSRATKWLLVFAVLALGTLPPGSPAAADLLVKGAVPDKARQVLREIEARHGQPPPGYVGNRHFGNFERRLPPGRYREYDVDPLESGRNRGPERIVIEQRTRRAWYTGDHYRTFVPMDHPPQPAAPPR
jgi:guanyl-specific ribonuclease Sa